MIDSATIKELREDGAYLLWFEDAEMQPILFSGAGARDAAIRAYEARSLAWNCVLFVDHKALASLASAGEDAQKPYRDAWQRIFADDSLALIRKRMSADNIMRIIRHVHAAMWRPIETLEGGENDFVLARTVDGRVMQWRASLLARNLKGPTPDHLSFPAIEWMPAPIKTPKPLSEG